MLPNLTQIVREVPARGHAIIWLARRYLVHRAMIPHPARCPGGGLTHQRVAVFLGKSERLQCSAASDLAHRPQRPDSVLAYRGVSILRSKDERLHRDRGPDLAQRPGCFSAYPGVVVLQSQD